MARTSTLGGKPGAMIPGTGAVSADYIGGFVGAGADYIWPSIPINTLTTNSVGSDRIKLVPFLVTKAQTCTAIALENTSGTGNIRVGLYEVGASNISLLQESASTSIGSSAVHEVDITDVSMEAGKLYMAGMCPDSSITWRCINTSNLDGFADYPTPVIGAAINCVWEDSHTYGALPATITFRDALGWSDAPVICLKVT